jgi:large subunit ribosomal protein L21
MYAVVKNGSRQYRVTKGATVVVDRLEGDVGSKLVMDEVLLVGSAGDVKVGAPTVKGAKVHAKVISHELGDKLEGFKYRPRKRYRKRMGFRASTSTIEITSIKA